MCKKMFKGGLVLALLIGVGAAVLGPQQAQQLMMQAQDNVQGVIDNQFDEHTKVRSQVAKLQAQLPKQISQVREDLSEINTQMSDLQREKSVCERVVTLIDRDLGMLEPQVQAASSHGQGTVSLASVKFRTEAISMSSARKKVDTLKLDRNNYLERSLEADRSLIYLGDQADQFEETLAELESDRARLDAQISQIDQEIVAIERNARMIELLETRRKKLDSYQRFEAGSLDSVQGKLKEIRARQQAELDYLAGKGEHVNYEQEALEEMQQESDIYEEAAERYEMPSVLHKANR
jgi:DNA repair exonuclease SbcCD ATPase subunit